MSNEMKRWWIDLRPHSNARAQGYSTRHSAWSRPIVRFGVNAVCVMPVEDHERIVAELKAEIVRLKVELGRPYDKVDRLFEANKKHLETIASQKRVIEKLKIIDQYFARHDDCSCIVEDDDPCGCGLSKVREEIEAIEKGEA